MRAIAIALFVFASTSIAGDNSWLLKYRERTSFASDTQFIALIKSIVPDSWQDRVFDILGGPPARGAVEADRYFSLNACKYNSCAEKAFFWYDLKMNRGMVIACFSTGDPAPVYYLSKQFNKADFPQAAIASFKKWATANEVLIGEEEYHLADEKPSSALSTNKPTETLIAVYQQSLKLYKTGEKLKAAQLLLSSAGTAPYSITTANVSIYNDLGFFLAEAGRNAEAKDILQAVIATFPERTVAYFNIGDAYSALKDTQKAKDAYRQYIALMKKAGKEKSIPARVLEAAK